MNTTPWVKASEQLKPCPFCGGTETKIQRSGSDDECAFIQCVRCEAGGPTIFPTRQEEDFPSWNSRTDQPVNTATWVKWSVKVPEHIKDWDKLQFRHSISKKRLNGHIEDLMDWEFRFVIITAIGFEFITNMELVEYLDESIITLLQEENERLKGEKSIDDVYIKKCEDQVTKLHDKLAILTAELAQANEKIALTAYLRGVQDARDNINNPSKWEELGFDLFINKM